MSAKLHELGEIPELGQVPSQMLAQLTFAQLIAWDIPTGLLAPSMQVAAAPST